MQINKNYAQKKAVNGIKGKRKECYLVYKTASDENCWQI